MLGLWGTDVRLATQRVNRIGVKRAMQWWWSLRSGAHLNSVQVLVQSLRYCSNTSGKVRVS